MCSSYIHIYVCRQRKHISGNARPKGVVIQQLADAFQFVGFGFLKVFPLSFPVLTQASNATWLRTGGRREGDGD